jgi:Uma2 family endonuclease
MAVATPRTHLTLADYHSRVESGVLTEDDRVELIEGEIVPMAAIGSRHAACVRRLSLLFFEGLGGRALVSAQNPVALVDDSELEPDIVLLNPHGDFYSERHPGAEDVLLVIEVADATLQKDRNRKGPLYARSGIREYWLLNLLSSALEVYRDPRPEGYGSVQVLRRGEAVSSWAFPDLVLDVASIFG